MARGLDGMGFIYLLELIALGLETGMSHYGHRALA